MALLEVVQKPLLSTASDTYIRRQKQFPVKYKVRENNWNTVGL